MRQNKVQRRTKENVQRAMRDLQALFAPIQKEERMKLREVRKCLTATCTTLTGAKYCSRCRRAMKGERASTAELITRAREDLANRDPLLIEAEGEQGPRAGRVMFGSRLGM